MQFLCNHGEENMLNHTVEGGPSRVTIDHCIFFNYNYSSALACKLKHANNAKLLFISILNFTTNTNKGGVIYILIYSANFTLVSLSTIVLNSRDR